MRNDVDSYDFIDIGVFYIKSEFPFDFLATFPTMVFSHSRNLLILRSLHIVHSGKTKFFLNKIAAKVYPNSMNTQDTLL